MIFDHGFVHSDMHPGNLFVKVDPTSKQIELGVVDCGIATEVGRHDHVNMVNICRAFLNEDGRTAALLMLDQRGTHNRESGDIEGFVQGIEEIVRVCWAAEDFVHFGQYCSDICSLACTHKVHVEPVFLAVALSLKVAEGMITVMDPEFKVNRAAIPVCIKAQARYAAEDLAEKMKQQKSALANKLGMGGSSA